MATKKKPEKKQERQEEKKFGLVAEEIEEIEEGKKEEAKSEFGDFDEDSEEDTEDFGFIPQSRPLRLESMFEDNKKQEPEEKKKEEKEDDKYKTKMNEEDGKNYKKLEPLEAKRIEAPEFARKSRGRGTREVFVEKIKSIEGFGSKNKKTAEIDDEGMNVKYGKTISGEKKHKDVEGLFEGEIEKEDYDIKELKKLVKDSGTEKEKS